ncbi:threonine/serine ThrE exporter family protein [Cellulomonas soli]|uniref:threonine/serine ThrE exporter family protein n=1 Tax=Cellulomonas soli TaxID=931535 RepID=UPI003F854ED5
MAAGDAAARVLGSVRSRVAAFLRAPSRDTAPDAVESVSTVDPDLVPLLTALGVCLLDAGQASNEVEEALSAVASARGDNEVRAFVVPTGVLVQVDDPGGVSTHYASSTGRPFSLGQVAALERLVRDVATGTTELATARGRLARLASAPPRFGPALGVLGNILLTVGFGLCQRPSPGAVGGLVILGTLVGLARATLPKTPALATALPVLASFVVSVLSTEVLGPRLGVDPITLITPALVTFLPGAALTTATIELTHNQVVSGASRLVYGLAQLMLLAFGVVASAAVVGAPDPVAPEPFGPWIAYVGVALVGCGFVLYLSAPKGSLPWIGLTLYSAFVAQAVGSAVLSPQLSGFVGGVVLIVVSRLIARLPSGPPRLVTALPGFWLLVPGALGFMGVSEIATSGARAGGELIDMVLALFSISLGILTGTGLSNEASSLRHTWQRRAQRP